MGFRIGVFIIHICICMSCIYICTHTFTYTYDIHICSHCSKMMIIHDHHYHQLSFHRTRLGSNLSAAVAAFIVRSGFGLPVPWGLVVGWVVPFSGCVDWGGLERRVGLVCNAKRARLQAASLVLLSFRSTANLVQGTCGPVVSIRYRTVSFGHGATYEPLWWATERRNA